MSDFKREERYIVVKLKDITDEDCIDLRALFKTNSIKTVECVVVESDWPNYEHVWETLEQVAAGTFDPDEITTLRQQVESALEGVGERENEIADLEKQLEQAEQENERVRQANLDVMMHFEDMKAAKEQAEARTQYLESSIRNAIGWIDGDLRDIIRDVGNQICSYNDLYESADRIEELLAQAIRNKAEEQEKGV